MIRTITIRLLAVCIACSLGLFAPARAEAASEARRTLEDTVNRVLKELHRPDGADQAKRKEIQANIEHIVLTLFSFEELSMRTVGPNWKNFTPDQRTRFIDAFANLLRERYTGALEDYNSTGSESVTYLRESPVGSSGDRVQIDTTVMVNNKPVPVNYRMQRGSGGWVVYDISIEGVGMIQNYRSQFQSVLQRGSVEELIALVRARADATRAENENRRAQGRS